jgi:hypothetical protein
MNPIVAALLKQQAGGQMGGMPQGQPGMGMPMGQPQGTPQQGMQMGAPGSLDEATMQRQRAMQAWEEIQRMMLQQGR